MEPQRRKRRTKANIEESIDRAAAQIIEKKGFANLTVTGICQKAKIEPVVFYNRYKDMNDFISSYVKKFDYWYSDLARYKEEVTGKEQYKELLTNLLFVLDKDKLMQELLRWEVATHNEITGYTAQLREFHTLPMVRRYEKEASNDVAAISALLTGGIYYLTLHKNLSPFAEIDLNTQEGKERIAKAVEKIVELLFEE